MSPLPSICNHVRLLSDDTCCNCRDPSRRCEIHHIDGNNRNDSLDNLAFLCRDCHNEAQMHLKPGGAGNLLRGLTPDFLTARRNDWYAVVESDPARAARARANVAVRIGNSSGFVVSDNVVRGYDVGLDIGGSSDFNVERNDFE